MTVNEAMAIETGKPYLTRVDYLIKQMSMQGPFTARQRRKILGFTTLLECERFLLELCKTAKTLEEYDRTRSFYNRFKASKEEIENAE